MPVKKIISNVSGTSRATFDVGLDGVAIGALDKPGILQGRDADRRTVRDLVQFNPRYVVAENHNQIATEWEIHDLSVAKGMVMLEAGSVYTLDQGAVLVA